MLVGTSHSEVVVWLREVHASRYSSHSEAVVWLREVHASRYSSHWPRIDMETE